MNRKARIEEEVERTLDLLRKKEEPEADPFFYTRLQSRIDGLEREGRKRHRLSGLIDSRHLRPTVVVAIVVINVLSGIMLFHGDTRQSQCRVEYLQAFAEEYSLYQNDYEQLFSN